MKICILFCVAILVSLSPLSQGFADDSAEDHICFKRVDLNHDDTATFQEFEKFYGNDPEKFQKMDQDNDGRLTHDEYEEYLYNQEE
ncbi:MAG: EF-hand domain-containing protein [Desulfobacula sp.]|nr:EF-hand domain-containing protein [Desulfobacula sp.]